jgi:hypothetical protein
LKYQTTSMICGRSSMVERQLPNLFEGLSLRGSLQAPVKNQSCQSTA